MGFPRQLMMENAGASMVKRIIEKFSDISSKKILVFAGLGNNGGDALVVARHLAGYGSKVIVILLGNPSDIKTIECKTNWEILEKMKSIQIGFGPDDASKFDVDIIIDGILGTGISGEVREPHASAINLINKTKAYKVSVDVPSGLDPDTGEIGRAHV